MDFIIEDGYNTTYIPLLLVSFFCEKSIIERCLLLDNNSTKTGSLYLQKIIYKNFVDIIRNNSCVSAGNINEILLCSQSLGWYCDYKEHNPFDFFNFILKSLNYSKLSITSYQQNIITQKLTNNKHMETQTYIELQNNGSIQESYDSWFIDHKINNFPMFVILKIHKNNKTLKIDKCISLFSKTDDYHNVRWSFHSMIKYDICKKTWCSIISTSGNLYIFDTTSLPHMTLINDNTLRGLKNDDLYFIYKKDPII